MDSATSTDNEPYGLRVEDRVGNRRKGSAVAAGGRKASAVAGNGEEAVAIVEGAQLSEEDRRLAEMGYVQVNSDFPDCYESRIPTPNTLTLPFEFRCTSESSRGSRASPSPFPSLVFSPVSPLLSPTLSTQEALPPPCGAGSSRARGVCVLPCPSPNSSPPTPRLVDYTSRANTSRRRNGFLRSAGSADG